MKDTIYRQDAIDAFMEEVPSYGLMDADGNIVSGCKDSDVIAMLEQLPSVQSAEAIPVAFLEEQAKWFESMDNAFAKIEANNIRVIIKKWRRRSEKDERNKDYCRDCDRSIYGKYHDCDINIENNGEYVMADPKCYCKIVNGKRAEKYPWEIKKNE